MLTVGTLDLIYDVYPFYTSAMIYAFESYISGKTYLMKDKTFPCNLLLIFVVNIHFKTYPLIIGINSPKSKNSTMQLCLHIGSIFIVHLSDICKNYIGLFGIELPSIENIILII